MVLARRLILVSLVITTTCACALADVTTLSRPTISIPSLTAPLPIARPTSAQDYAFEAVSFDPRNCEGRYDSLRSWPAGGVACVPLVDWRGDAPQAGAGRESPEQPVIELPAAPSGGMLAFSGLLTLGAWQAARSARNVHLASMLHAAHVPDWYHPDATQVRHIVPFEFRLTLQPILNICGLLALDPDPARSLASQSDGDADRLGTPQYSLSTTAPRGPPSLS